MAVAPASKGDEENSGGRRGAPKSKDGRRSTTATVGTVAEVTCGGVVELAYCGDDHL
jgi:hypothetical protein